MEQKNILKPKNLTEKTSRLMSEQGQYTFYVPKDSNKFQVKKMVEKLYGVTVLSVNTMRLGGGKKTKKYTNKGVFYITKSIQKKVIVTLQKGQTIEMVSAQ